MKIRAIQQFELNNQQEVTESDIRLKMVSPKKVTCSDLQVMLRLPHCHHDEVVFLSNP